MSPKPRSVDLSGIGTAVSVALAEEELHHQLRDSLLHAVIGAPADFDQVVSTLAERIRNAIAAVPERLAVIDRAAAGPVARTRILHVLRAIAAYWDQPDDLIPDRFGLPGRIDDALVCHVLLDRLNRWHLETEGTELAPLEGQLDLDLRGPLSEEASRRVMRLIDDIWEERSRGPAFEPFNSTEEVFAPIGVDTSSSAGKTRGRPQAPAPAPPNTPDDAPRRYEVWFGTNRLPLDPADLSKGFGGQRDERGIHYGVCDVAIPKTHKFGSIGTAWWKRWLRLEFADDHIKIIRRRSFDGEVSFLDDLRTELGSSEGKQLLFYLHGFNVSFDEAAIRAAQLFADLKVPGAAAFFSWPSKASVDDYFADVERIGESEADIAAFLTSLATQLGGATVHVIAHSMGNRGLARAIQRITSAAARQPDVRFGQIILAAPDVSVGLFNDLARVYPSLSQRTTMYVSARDRALGLSRWLQDAPRAGFTPPVTVVPNIDTIEVTNVDLTLLGHGYYAEAESVLYDIAELLRHDAAPGARVRLQPAPLSQGQSPYWMIGA